MAGGSGGGTGANVFLRREEELAELRAGFQDAMAGRGRLFLLAGDAGIGKTRLLDAFIEEVERTEARAVLARCWHPRAAGPFWLWREVLLACIGAVEQARALAAHVGRGGTDLALLVPELAKRVRGVAPAPPSSSPDARLRLFDAIADFLQSLALEGGLVVAVDDLHAADEASLQLLLHVVGRNAHSPVLMVGTYRDADVRSAPQLYRLMAAIARQGRRLVLGGLNENDVAALFEDRMGGPVDAAVVRQALLTTDGIPLFVQELARVLRRQGPAAIAAIAEDIHVLIERRIDELPGAQREIVEIAAVIERPFDTSLLANAGGTALAAVEKLLRALIDQELTVELEPGRWAFTHELVREVVYHGMPASRRIVGHRRVAQALEGDDRRSVGSPAELAHHFFEAARAGEGAPARRWCGLAGEVAMGKLAYEEAAVQYGRALEALAVAPPVDERERHGLLLRVASAHLRLGDLPQARELQRQALKSARAAGSAELLAEAAVAFVGELAWLVDDSQASVLAEARAALPSDDSPLLARVLVALAAATPRADVAFALSNEAVAMARRTGDALTLLAVLSIWHGVNADTDVVNERLAVVDELIALAGAAGDRETRQRARQWRGQALLELGQVGAAAAELELAAQEADGLRLFSVVASTASRQAGLAVLQGRLADAERLVTLAVAAAERSAVAVVADDVYSARYALCREEGRVEETVDVARRWLRDSPDGPRPVTRAMLAVALAELGKSEEAREEIASLVVELLHNAEAGRPAGAALLADVSWLVGERQWAEETYQCLLRWPDRHLVVGAGCSLGASGRYLGQLAALLGRPDEAEAHFRAAHRLHERLGARAWLAHGLADHARMLLRDEGAGDAARSRELLAAARQEFGALGMAAHDERVAALTDLRPAEADEPERGVLSLEGEYWAVEYRGDAARVRDSKGLRYLARLLRAPGQELHALDLVVGESGGSGRRPVVRDAGLEAASGGDAGTVLDATAKAAYRRRLRELQEEVEEAAAFNDLGRADQAQQEIDFLMRELAAAVGLGGRDRKAASDAERARQSVTRAVKGAIERVAAVHPALGQHLRTTVRTGIYSSYTPDPRVPIRWESQEGAGRG